MIEFHTMQGVHVAILSDCKIFDDAAGREFLAAVKARVPQGRRLVANVVELEEVTPEGLPHLVAVNKWLSTPGHKSKNLTLVGLDHAAAVFLISEAGFIFDFEATMEEAISAGEAEAPAAAAKSAPAAQARARTREEIEEDELFRTVPDRPRPTEHEIPLAAAQKAPAPEVPSPAAPDPAPAPVPPPEAPMASPEKVKPPQKAAAPAATPSPAPEPAEPAAKVAGTVSGTPRAEREKEREPAASAAPAAVKVKPHVVGDKSRWAEAAPPARDAPYPQTGPQRGYWIPFIIVGLLAVVGGAGIVIWKGLLTGGEPEITISTPKIEVERLGREPDVVEVVVKNGQLNLDEANRELPTGLEFVAESEEDDPEQVYSLGGIAGFDSQSKTVNLYGVNGGKRSVPVTLSVVVKRKPLLWQLESLKSLKLQVGRTIEGFSKFVSGAQSVTADQLPPGIFLQTTTPISKDWQLRGLPTEAVEDFPVKFTASPPTGSEMVETIKLTVAPAAPLIAASQTYTPFVPNVGNSAGVTPIIPGAANVVAAAPPSTVAATPPPAPAPPGSPPPAAPPTVAAAPPSPAPAPVPGGPAEAAVPAPAATPAAATLSSDEGMRSFMLARIDKLDSRYTDIDRERLRTVVEYLTASRLIMRVTFEKDGQVTMSDAEKERLKGILQSPDVAALLKRDSCQILVVGYASRSGSFASSVRASKKRAASVDKFLKEVVGFNADLCGDYGPTDVLDQTSAANNRAVEIFAGVLDLPAHLRPVADRFKEDFNKRHGVHGS